MQRTTGSFSNPARHFSAVWRWSVSQALMLLAVAGQGAGAVSQTGAGVLQHSVARRAHNAAVEVDEHGRGGGMGVVAGGTGSPLLNVFRVLFEADVAHDAVLHVVALIAQGVTAYRKRHARAGQARGGRRRLQRALPLQQVTKVG